MAPRKAPKPRIQKQEKKMHPGKVPILNTKKKKAKETAKTLAKLPKPKLSAKTLEYNRKLKDILERLEKILKEVKDTVKGFNEETGEEDDEIGGQDVPGDEDEEDFLQI